MFQSNESKRTYSYLLIIFTIIMFGIAIYLLMTQGSSHGIVWGGRYGNKLEGTLNGLWSFINCLRHAVMYTLLVMAKQAKRFFHFNGRNKKCSNQQCHNRTSKGNSFIRILSGKNMYVYNQ